jgi:hypothetical protein
MAVIVALTGNQGAHAQPPDAPDAQPDAPDTPPNTPDAQPDAPDTPPDTPDAQPETTPDAAGDVAAELARLEGQSVRVVNHAPHGTGVHVGEDRPRGRAYVIEDVAGEGAPVVGVVERRDQALWLVAADGARYRLAGALARPRIAGPGYKIWALGAVTSSGGERVLVARRIGVLASPWQRAQALGARKTIFAISAGAATRTGGPQ